MSTISPSNALSTRVMLATGVHAQPGVYALLLGSGISSSAGISTGWQIVSHLVQKIAAAANPDDTASHEAARDDPEKWWSEHGAGELGYSSLLEAIAPSSPARQGLLAEYFEASDEDRANGLKVPTAAHNAIAQLVKAGWIKVIVTTNFDRLMEQALEAVGVAPQVISRSEAVAGATPLAHSPATVIKLHGDWKDLEFRNTLDELTTYPQPWIDLLTQVFSEYGLLVSGWSAEWDKALVRILEASPRRYPLYWDSRSSKREAARNLLTLRGGQVIEAASADDLFADLSASVDALTRLSEPPLTTAMAVSRLKRALPDPIRRIELRDLILDYTANVAKTLASAAPKTREWADMDAHLDDLLEAVKPLLTLLVAGIRYDDGTHAGLWVEALQRVLERPGSRGDSSAQIVDELRNYPALLVLRAMCLQATREGGDSLIIALLTRPRWEDALKSGRSPIAADVLHTLNIINDNFANGLPRWDGTTWAYPRSHLMKMVLKDFFEDQGLDYPSYRLLVSDVEYRTGFVQYLLSDSSNYRHRPDSGEFVHRDEWTSLDNTWENQAPRTEVRFREAIARDGSAAWATLLGDRDMDAALVGYREILKQYEHI